VVLSRRAWRRAASVLVGLVLVSTMIAPASAAESAGNAETLLGPRFLTAFNYEGPADRAWAMWYDDLFDASLIDEDFARAASAGVSAMRIFVQAPLAQDIAAGNWAKLDQVVGLAEKRKLQLILSLYDYADRDVARVSAVAGRVAARYRGRTGILAYDLKNEPRFGDLALGHYGSPVPLQEQVLIDTFGERLTREEMGDFRASDEGRREVPSSLSDDEAWIYVNNLRLYREMLNEATAWVRRNGGTSLDYIDHADGMKWRPLTNALDATLRAWMGPQIQAIRAADPSRPITLAHVDAMLAKLAANQMLDYQTLHRYPGTGAASVRATLTLIGKLQDSHGSFPYVLGEFGYPSNTVDPEVGALHETAVFLGLIAQNAAGGAKWMLNDMPEGFNMRERTLGAFRLDGSPKPVVNAMTVLNRYLANSSTPPASFRLEDDAEVGLHYVYTASGARLLGGKNVSGSGVAFEADGPAQLFVTWAEPTVLYVWASAGMDARIDLQQVLGRNPSQVSLLHQEGQSLQTLPLAARSGASITLNLPQAGYYQVRLGAS